LLKEVEANTEPRTLLATTSATESLDELRESLQDPARLAGLHFIPPVGRGSVVEVIRSGVPENRLHELASSVVRLGCLPVVVNFRPGLLVQRVWMAAIHESILLLQEDIQLAHVEEAMRRFGMTRGPFEIADQIGAKRLEQLAAVLPARFPGMETFFALMVAKGWLGQESKQGFYVYRSRGRPLPNTKITMLAGHDPEAISRREPLSRRDQLLLCETRNVARTVNEAARCLEEKVVENADELDLALAGAGWAPHRGGPLTYARQESIDGIIAELEELATRYGARFNPSPALRGLGQADAK
jgi:3-hydroxyacyl-CoA dehydrogenase/enoyl-CoA hydratase/3-hydroxybutyryl-CoA epimerase